MRVLPSMKSKMPPKLATVPVFSRVYSQRIPENWQHLCRLVASCSVKGLRILRLPYPDSEEPIAITDDPSSQSMMSCSSSGSTVRRVLDAVPNPALRILRYAICVIPAPQLGVRDDHMSGVTAGAVSLGMAVFIERRASCSIVLIDSVIRSSATPA